jgi:tRNA nucleotidyltransferase/poly(A) polymerase
MSDYIYMLESHLSPEQNRAVADVQEVTLEANVNVFLTGGAMRDMLAGYRIRDLDFVVEGNALKVAKALAERGAQILSIDETRKCAELLFPGGVTAMVAMSKQLKFPRPGARPQVSPATIQEDLRGRDFTCNAIALSLNKSSRGLLLDPMNGLADIGRREMRAVTPYGFYDDPSRLLRLVRLSVRLGFTVEERTAMQVANAREAGVEKSISGPAIGEELRRIALEDSPSEVLTALEPAGLLALFSPALAGPHANPGGIARLEKAYRLLPDDGVSRSTRLGPFFLVLTEKFTPKEKQALMKTAEVSKTEIEQWRKLEARARKLEAALRSPRLRKPSHVYHLAAAAPPDEMLLVLYRSTLKPVQERLRNYLEKYLPQVLEITPEEWADIPVKPGTPRYAKARAEFISRRLDRRPPKTEPIPEGPPAGPASVVPPAAVEGAGARRAR